MFRMSISFSTLFFINRNFLTKSKWQTKTTAFGVNNMRVNINPKGLKMKRARRRNRLAIVMINERKKMRIYCFCELVIRELWRRAIELITRLLIRLVNIFVKSCFTSDNVPFALRCSISLSLALALFLFLRHPLVESRTRAKRE